MNKPALGFALCLISVFAGCGGGSMSSTMLPPPPPARVVNANVTVDNLTAGSFDVAMSTSFQPAEWDYTFFQTSLAAKTTLLGNLQPHHIRLQGISQGVPQGAAGTNSANWDFTILDSITQPVLAVGDHSPEFQIAKAAPFMYANNDSSQSFADLTFAQFAAYSKNLVQYYNTGGFTSSGVHFASPSSAHITWWGIYNEPSINNNLDATEYTTMYNAVVPGMKSADPTIKLVALELCCGSEDWTQTFAANVNAPVDAVASHYYSTCNQKDTDQQVFNTVPGFASSVQSIYNDLSANASLSNVPVWITENNVNADFDKGGGISACNNTTFVADKRGSSAFFAAWRPYVFSRVGRAGARALYHWDFDADAQFGEVDFNTGNPQLSYWVDYWLAQMFPSGSSAQLLQSTNSDGAEIEILPIMNTDGSVVVMVSNHAVAAPLDNDGDGLTADVAVDVSALGAFSSASEVVIDSSTSPTTGPSSQSISATSPIKLSLNGYSVAIIKLQ
jgi:hypothetical protein